MTRVLPGLQTSGAGPVAAAGQLAQEAAWLLEQIGVRSGARALEIGCGPPGCLDLLAARVGPAGRVVGIERSEESMALARELVTERGLRNVEVLHGGARSVGLAKASFDLVTARLVLVNAFQARSRSFRKP